MGTIVSVRNVMIHLNTSTDAPDVVFNRHNFIVIFVALETKIYIIKRQKQSNQKKKFTNNYQSYHFPCSHDMKKCLLLLLLSSSSYIYQKQTNKQKK